MTPEQQAFFDRFSPYATKLAWKWVKSRGAPNARLMVSTALEALFMMSKRLDPNVPSDRLHGWVRIRVEGAMVDHIRDVVPIPRTIYEQHEQITALREAGATDDEICKEMGISEDRLWHVLFVHMVAFPASLDEPVISPKGQLVVAQHGDDWGYRNTMLSEIQGSQLWSELKRYLKGSDYEIIRLRIVEEMQFHKIGAIFGFSEARAFQIYTAAIKNIRRLIEDGTIKGLSPTGASWNSDNQSLSA